MASRSGVTHSPASPTPHAEEDRDAQESIHEEDLCPVCHQLLYRPVTTQCNHTLCESCMTHWADVSAASAQMTIVSLDEEPTTFNASEVEARCPMCRTTTTASINSEMSTRFTAQYPGAYKERELEERPSSSDGSLSSLETLTVYVGNKHEILDCQDTPNMHEWTFFVKPSRTDIIESVRILLHPTFRPNSILRSEPPYEIQRRGWGYFTIEANVALKRGYSWISDDATHVPGRWHSSPKALLPLQWTLDFDGFGGKGSMGRCRLKVKVDG